jgi:hypothetical protein
MLRVLPRLGDEERLFWINPLHTCPSLPWKHLSVHILDDVLIHCVRAMSTIDSEPSVCSLLRKWFYWFFWMMWCSYHGSSNYFVQFNCVCWKVGHRGRWWQASALVMVTRKCTCVASLVGYRFYRCSMWSLSYCWFDCFREKCWAWVVVFMVSLGTQIQIYRFQLVGHVQHFAVVKFVCCNKAKVRLGHTDIEDLKYLWHLEIELLWLVNLSGCYKSQMALWWQTEGWRFVLNQQDIKMIPQSLIISWRESGLGNYRLWMDYYGSMLRGEK